MVQLNDDDDKNLAPRTLNSNATQILQRTMGALYEASPEMEDNNEGKIFFYCINNLLQNWKLNILR